jgi:hypothetical protein
MMRHMCSVSLPDDVLRATAARCLFEHPVPQAALDDIIASLTAERSSIANGMVRRAATTDTVVASKSTVFISEKWSPGFCSAPRRGGF